MLKKLIPSRILYKLIEYYCNNDDWIHVRDVARRINEDCSNVGKAAKCLEKAGVLESRKDGVLLQYRSIPSDNLDALRTLL